MFTAEWDNSNVKKPELPFQLLGFWKEIDLLSNGGTTRLGGAYCEDGIMLHVLQGVA
jgi:hypothetical protein